MPLFEQAPSAALVKNPVEVTASFAVELQWLAWLLALQKPREIPGVDLSSTEADGLGKRVREFWADGDAGLQELLVLADVAGVLGSLRPDDLVPAVAAAAARPPEPERLGLGTETEAVRAAIEARLRELASDAGRRRRWEWLLRDLAAFLRPAWEEHGRARAEAAAAELRARLAEGASPLELLPLLPPAFAAHVEAALTTRPLTIVPAHVSGNAMIVDLPTTFLAGTPADPVDVGRQLRRQAAVAVGPLKALADATRLAVLAYLAGRPASVSQLAERFRLSQPTVSVHLKTLREAGLVRGEQEGTRTLYRLDEARLDSALDAVRSLLCS